jgi:hypothetical protein
MHYRVYPGTTINTHESGFATSIPKPKNFIRALLGIKPTLLE